MDVDPLASMRCWAIEIELGGRTYDVPALPAADWWPVLESGEISQILDMITSSPDSPFDLDDILLEGMLDKGALREALTDALEAVAGRSFHAAFVLATVAKTQWSAINGTLVRSGFRWDVQPLGAALDAIYAVVVSRLDKEALDKFLALLDNETLTQPGKKKTPSQRVVSEFEAMAGPKPTTGAVATGEQSDNARPKTQPRPQPLRQGDPSRVPRRPRAPRAGSGPAASS